MLCEITHSASSNGTNILPQKKFKAKNSVALLAALKEVSKSRDLDEGRKIHAQAIETGAHLDMYVASSLVDMFTNCGSMEEAHKVFDGMAFHDVVSWNALMLGYAENGNGDLALELFVPMQSQGCAANDRTFVAAVKACTSLAAKEFADSELRKIKSLEKGMALHSEAVTRKLDTIYVSSCLVDMYAKCGSLADAHRVFDEMPRHNMVSWTALMLGYVENDDGDTALELFSAMQREGCLLDGRSFVAALKACSSLAGKEKTVDFHGKSVKLRSLERGMALHSLAAKCTFQSDLFVACGLIDMYAKVGLMEAAQWIFEQYACGDVVSWTALTLGYADNGENKSAVKVFVEMVSRGYVANSRTYVAVLKACSSLAEEEEEEKEDRKLLKVQALSTGMWIHSQAAKTGCDSADIFVGNTLIDMYAKCGTMAEAQRVFDRLLLPDVVSWNALTLGYADNGEPQLALELFVVMQSEGFLPNSLTYLAAVKACSFLSAREESRKLDDRRLVKVASLERGMSVHAGAARSGVDDDIMVASSLVDMYVKCGSTEDAQRAFDRIQTPDVIAWTGLISGYAENGESEAALELFASMKLKPDACTYVAALKACGCSGDLRSGKALHGEICRCGMESNVVVATAVIDSFGKCGSMFDAEIVFGSCCEAGGDVVAWTALITGYGQQGNSEMVFAAFREMVESGVRPVGVTFLCVLTVCSHAGLVEKGRKCFEEMRRKYGVEAEIEHYHCVIDLLGRTNHLDDAVEVVRSMPFEATAVTWITVLSACRQWKNVAIGSLAFESLVAMSSGRGEAVKASAYLLMANIYESLGLWDRIDTMRSKFGHHPVLKQN